MALLSASLLVAGCGVLAKAKKDSADSSHPETATEPATETQTGAGVGSGTQATVTTQFPWAEFERCGGGLIDVIKSEPGQPLGKHSVSSLPFEVEAKFGTKTFKANFVLGMNIEIYVDRYLVDTVVDLHEPTAEMQGMVLAAKASGLDVPPWTFKTESTLPSFEEFDAVNARLGWEKPPCSLIPVRRRVLEARGVKRTTAYDPGLPEILSPVATLAELKEELGVAREFPAVDAKEWKGANEAQAVVTSVVLRVSEVKPSDDELKALGITAPTPELTGFAFERAATGEAVPTRTVVVFDTKTGERIGTTLQFSDPNLVKPALVGLPPLK